jgi:hypothetical protein
VFSRGSFGCYPTNLMKRSGREYYLKKELKKKRTEL